MNEILHFLIECRNYQLTVLNIKMIGITNILISTAIRSAFPRTINTVNIGVIIIHFIRLYIPYSINAGTNTNTNIITITVTILLKISSIFSFITLYLLYIYLSQVQSEIFLVDYFTILTFN